MQVIGIVAEYNPFHTGHAYQIARTRQSLGGECAVVAVMSGNWVQQADCAIADKWLRARLALMGGVDLVLELPTVWATASAESFARGAISLLERSGVVDVLSFGSEGGEVDKLAEVAACLNTPAYQQAVAARAGSGLPFAVCRQQAVEELLGSEYGALLSRPNNNLGIEYIRSLRAGNSSIRPMTVLRQGADHNALLGSADHENRPPFVSATQIRMDLMEGNWDRAQPYLVPGGRAVLEGSLVGLPGLRRVERAVLAKLRTMGAENWAKLPDSGQAEGLPQRLERAGKQCTDLEDFFNRAKTKRYTHARLRRLVLWAHLGITTQDIPHSPPYLRVLGFNARGQELLRQMKDCACLPILTKPAHARQLSEKGQRLFELEARCTDLYDLCFETILPPGREWTTGPVRMLKEER